MSDTVCINSTRSGALGARLMSLLEKFAEFTDEPGALTRLYLSPAHRAAAEYLLELFGRAGAFSSIDAVGNVVARYEGATPDAPVLLIGSHIDTVRNAGKYDGNLGVLAGLVLLEELARNNETFPFAIEVLAFGDEEGVRFPATLSGSRAIAGSFDAKALRACDHDGIPMSEALRMFGGDPRKVIDLGRDPISTLAFVEVHIEQGPLLQTENLPVAVVTAISGATRLSVKVDGFAGHAGTVPMNLRRDALAAASEMVLVVEQLANDTKELVATVGQITAHPGAANVICGQVEFTVDVRSPIDSKREKAVASMRLSFDEIARSRRVSVSSRMTHQERASLCDSAIVDQMEAAVARRAIRPFRLESGAGHDTMAMAKLCPTGMLFVRCKDGISHNPAECISVEDANIAIEVLLDFVRNFRPVNRDSVGRRIG